MATPGGSSFRARPVHILAIFAICFGSVSLLVYMRNYGWVVWVFGLAWVVVVGAFAWEMVTRAGRLDSIVQSRTDALEATNRQLTTLLEQLHSFHRLSYRINQKLELREITRSFAGRLYDNFPVVNGVWIWLDTERMGGKLSQPDEPQDGQALQLAAQCGRDFGLPPEMRRLEPGHGLAAACFEGRSVSVPRGLQRKAAQLGWSWLEESPMDSFVAVPLRVTDTLIGVLGVFSKRSASREFVRQLTLSVNQFAIALEKARLVQHLRRRARQLAAANQELRQLDRMKDWFISSVSHELRTPLTSIRSFSEILQDYEDLSPEERLEFAGIIREESQRLGEMIDELLNLAKLAHGEIGSTPAPFRLGPLVERTCRLFQQQAEGQDIELRQNLPEDLPPIYADEMAVARVLNNLVSNAFKFTPSGGRVEISAEPQGEQSAVVRVSDTGVGISPEDQERIFERFTQVRNELTDKTPGTGIGLAICKELVEKSGGEIAVSSTPGEGSTFSFALPLGDEDALEGAQKPAQAGPGKQDGQRKSDTGTFVDAVRSRARRATAPRSAPPEKRAE
jgi:signal transduction histidine kinase